MFLVYYVHYMYMLERWLKSIIIIIKTMLINFLMTAQMWTAQHGLNGKINCTQLIYCKHNIQSFNISNLTNLIQTGQFKFTLPSWSIWITTSALPLPLLSITKTCEAALMLTHLRGLQSKCLKTNQEKYRPSSTQPKTCFYRLDKTWAAPLLTSQQAQMNSQQYLCLT